MKRVILIILAVIVILAVSGIFAAEYYTSQPEFCGSCHIMKKYYNTWKKSKHGEEKIACVDCHYAPGEAGSMRAKFKGLGQLFSYLATAEKEVRKAPIVSDLSCTASDCHPDEKYIDKKVKFTEKIPYIHKTHFDKKIEGQELHCDTCHQHVTGEKHFEVPKEVCYLCHFKETKFNEGRAKCSLCHEIPTKSLQKQKKEAKPDEKSITHQTLEKAKVPCNSCHFELVQGKGEVKERECLDCHEIGEALEALKKKNKKEILHKEHVAGQHANCFDCHEPISHRETDFLDAARLNCSGCHPDHHIYQRMLLIGDKRKGVPKTPGLMFDVKTTCIGCHTEEKLKRGEKVAHGSGKACAACHTPKHEGMAKEWKDKTDEELKNAKEIEKEALETIKSAKGRVSKKKLKEAMAMFKEGQENMHIVEYGGGVHNKKYSIMLLDIAMNNFEDAIDLLSD